MSVRIKPRGKRGKQGNANIDRPFQLSLCSPCSPWLTLPYTRLKSDLDRFAGRVGADLACSYSALQFALEVKPQLELNEARRIPLRGDAPEVRAVDVCARVVPKHVVKRVDQIQPKFQ